MASSIAMVEHCGYQVSLSPGEERSIPIGCDSLVITGILAYAKFAALNDELNNWHSYIPLDGQDSGPDYPIQTTGINIAIQTKESNKWKTYSSIDLRASLDVYWNLNNLFRRNIGIFDTSGPQNAVSQLASSMFPMVTLSIPVDIRQNVMYRVAFMYRDAPVHIDGIDVMLIGATREKIS
jgi:hypothetical protein